METAALCCKSGKSQDVFRPPELESDCIYLINEPRLSSTRKLEPGWLAPSAYFIFSVLIWVSFV